MSKPSLELILLPGELSICHLPAGSVLPAWAVPEVSAARGPLASVTWTIHETSAVCASILVPDDVKADSGWRALEVMGPLELSLTGILASLAGPLAEAGVALFAVSTYDTDYVLIKTSSLESAIETLRAAGHSVR
jgi:hypothetical protein